MQSVQHSKQQLIEEMCQLKVDKTKEKESQQDLEHVADKEETHVGSG